MKRKNIFCFFLIFLLAAFCHAEALAKGEIEGPSKEETVDFIKKYFDKNFFMGIANGKAPGFGYKGLFYRDLFLFFYTSKAGCKFSVDWRVEDENEVAEDKGSGAIFLGDVAAIELYKKTYRGGDSRDGVIFISARSKDMVEIGSFPIFQSKFDLSELEDQQIVKAFRHLRKLCGGPEPVKF